ncbi:hypothetical protein [Shinella zoogloeoides]|uniref:hypothetical protein n=1 Tax=Shinella zoogloeoides TaxID=352475 RepID=UPI001F56327B|nr:hypothetical protein [Shinella zoogloeoides]
MAAILCLLAFCAGLQHVMRARFAFVSEREANQALRWRKGETVLLVMSLELLTFTLKSINFGLS